MEKWKKKKRRKMEKRMHIEGERREWKREKGKEDREKGEIGQYITRGKKGQKETK